MTPLSITASISGQAWRWRGAAGAGQSDDLVAQLLLSRGCPPDALDAHRDPTIRGFMPDPSIFQDMDRAAERLADAVQGHEAITVYGDYDVDGATSAALLIAYGPPPPNGMRSALVLPMLITRPPSPICLAAS